MAQVLEELITRIKYDVDNAGLNRYLNAQKKIKKNTKDMIGLNSILAKGLRRLFVGAGAIMGINGLVQTYRNFDMVQRSLNALTGSAELGAEHFEFLKRAAMQTGTGIMEVAKAYRGYYYAAKTAGLADDELQHSFLGVMVGARVLGANKQQVGGAMLALEQMLNKTTVQAQEMNLQLGNAISGAKEMAAEAMGMTVPEFVEKMQKKMINSAEFVRKFGDYMYQTFINKLPEAMKSLDASVINLENAWLLFQYEVMKGGLGDEITKLTAELMQLLMSPEAKSFAKTLGVGLNLLGKALSFCVKHFRLILFLFGVNSLLKIGTVLNRLKFGILDIATSMNTGLTPALQNVVAQLANMIFYGGGLKNVMKALRVASVSLGKSFLWLTVIAGILYSIYLVFEDIFMYLTDPTALTMTGEMAKSSEDIRKSLESIKTSFIEIRPQLEALLPMITQFLTLLLPVMAKITEWGLWLGINFLDSVLGIVRAFSDWGDKTVTLKDRLQDLAKFLYSVIGVIGGAIAGFALTGGNPLGAIIGAVAGGISAIMNLIINALQKDLPEFEDAGDDEDYE